MNPAKLKTSILVARDIVQTMYDQGMKPGDRYLSEADAIRHHKVGRGTYREALRFLESQGVIVMRLAPDDPVVAIAPVAAIEEGDTKE